MAGSSIEAHHADLALAILSAFVEVQRVTASSSQTASPPRRANLRAALTDNFA